MKTGLRIAAAILVCAFVALVVLRFTGLDPSQQTPGLWLSGKTAAFPADWTFAAQYRTLDVETHTWYRIPHSVTIYFVTEKGNLYLHADYRGGQTFPNGKAWTANIGHDPNIRVKVGDRVYDAKVVLVTDPTLYNTLFEDFRTKYPRSPYSNYSRRKDVFFLHVVPR